MRRFAISYLKRENAKTPDVYLAIIGSLTLNEFGGHPIDGSNFGFSHILFLCELSREAEVAELNVSS